MSRSYRVGRVAACLLLVVLGCNEAEKAVKAPLHRDGGEEKRMDALPMPSAPEGVKQAAVEKVTGAAADGGEHTRNLWGEFVRDPNPETFERCKGLIQEAVDGHASYEYGYGKPSPAAQQIEGSYVDDSGRRVYIFSEVERLVIEANPYAMELVMFYAPLTDGGNAEDLCRALGQSIPKRPALFLKLLKHYMNQERGKVSYMIGMLPLETADQPTRQAQDEMEDALIAERVRAFESVDDPEVSEMRDLCLKALTGKK